MKKKAENFWMYIKVRVYEEEGELRGFVQAKALGPLQSSHLE